MSSREIAASVALGVAHCLLSSAVAGVAASALLMAVVLVIAG